MASATTSYKDSSSFNKAVLERDHNKCVMCGASPNDNIDVIAHQIFDIRLYSDNGYHLSNGAALCHSKDAGCANEANSTSLSVEEIQLKAGIETLILPDILVAGSKYDKWGNEILRSGARCRGPLFHETDVKEALAGVTHLFSEYTKHYRTWHLPFSPGTTSDDKKLKNTQQFAGKHVTVTRKMDGENFTGYKNYSHARSVDGRHHPSRDYAKRFWTERSYDLPEGWRVVCENLYAVHSLRYENLPDWMVGLFIWDETNTCLSFENTSEWMNLLRIPMPEVLYSGLWDEATIRNLHLPERDDAEHEGYVVRLSGEFHGNQFKQSVAKYVRDGHVQSDIHWMHADIEVNGKLG